MTTLAPSNLARPIWKRLTILLSMTVAFGVSLMMLQRVVGLATPWMMLIVFFCFLGLARIAEPVYMLKVPRALRRLRQWELGGGVYRKLGVAQFGALLRDTPLRLLNAAVYLSAQRRDLVEVRRQIESAEAIHFWAALALMPYLVVCGWSAKWAVLGCFVIVQIVGNAYPIMHLRCVRGRLERLQRRSHGATTPRRARAVHPGTGSC